MAELPKAYFRPERSSENSLEPQIIANLQYAANLHGVQNVGMFHSNNQNFMQTFVPHDPPTPVQQRGFSVADLSNSNDRGPVMPPFGQYNHWPPNWNNPGASNYHLGVQHVGFYPTQSLGAVIPFDRSVPPPLPQFTTPPTQQQCIPNQGEEAVESAARKLEVPGSLEENDQMWIESWLHHHPQQGTAHPSSVALTKRKMKVWGVKQLLQSCLSLMSELEMIERELKSGCEEMDEVEWNGKLKEAEMKKMMLSKSLGVLDEEVLSSVRLALLKRGRKRSRMRGRRVLDKEIVAAKKEKRIRLHLEADMWLEGKQAEVDLHKREEMLKQEADAVLWEVRRKQSEGRRILSLLSALVKLHHVRVRKNDPASNPALSENEDQFQIIIDKLSSLWERQMSDYEAEERALRVMLSESPEGGGVMGGSSKDRSKARGDLQRSLRLWESLLFGSGSKSQELLSLGTDSCQWLYLQPSKALDALIENRRQWDQFISTSPSASSVPVGWVIPAEASSEEWKALIGSRGEFN